MSIYETRCIVLGLCLSLLVPFLQAWLQRFAWTEQKLKQRKQARDSLPADKTLLEREPMFCFETAVKLLYWCGFVKEHGEGRPMVCCSTHVSLHHV